ncbi:hypothetical protein FQN60_014143, partial [Etheostoma spectabile]
MRGRPGPALLSDLSWETDQWQEGRPPCQKMDCCPVLVSDLPVLCSRIDGVVTVVKAEHPNSTRHDLYWETREDRTKRLFRHYTVGSYDNFTSY